jgi:hypothetical protein
MNTFRYRVSQRMIHPDIDPDLITREIGLEPRRTWTRGHPRQTPTGQPLEENYRDSYWYYAYDAPDDTHCADFIRSSVTALQKHRDFFHRLRSEGADLEFFVGLFSSRNFGETFEHDLLAVLGDLKIDLGFDIYPDDTTVT